LPEITKSTDYLQHQFFWFGQGRLCGTKYRYQVLTGDVQLCCRELLRQTCNVLDVQILKGVVSKDHIHRTGDPASCVLPAFDLVRRLKGRSAKLLLGEFPELKRRYWAGLPLQGAFLGDWLRVLERGQHH